MPLRIDGVVLKGLYDDWRVVLNRVMYVFVNLRLKDGSLARGKEEGRQTEGGCEELF